MTERASGVDGGLPPGACEGGFTTKSYDNTTSGLVNASQGGRRLAELASFPSNRTIGHPRKPFFAVTAWMTIRDCYEIVTELLDRTKIVVGATSRVADYTLGTCKRANIARR
jgi:hypothetical protein